MTFPHGPAPSQPAPKPSGLPAGWCRACKHPPAYHRAPRMRRPWGGRTVACTAWDPDQPDWSCHCEGHTA